MESVVIGGYVPVILESIGKNGNRFELVACLMNGFDEEIYCRGNAYAISLFQFDLGDNVISRLVA